MDNINCYFCISCNSCKSCDYCSYCDYCKNLKMTNPTNLPSLVEKIKDAESLSTTGSPPFHINPIHHSDCCNRPIVCQKCKKGCNCIEVVSTSAGERLKTACTCHGRFSSDDSRCGCKPDCKCHHIHLSVYPTSAGKGSLILQG